MKRLFLILTAIPFFFASCTKCYDCKKQIIIENAEGEEVASDAYFEEEACSEGEKDGFEDQGYKCRTQL